MEVEYMISYSYIQVMTKQRSKAGAASHSMSDELLDAVAWRFRVLSVPSRLRILNLLMIGSLPMAELERLTGLEQSNLSRQVTELEQAGCVARYRDGRSVRVEISDPTIEALCDLVCGAVRDRASRTHAAMHTRSRGRRGSR